MKLPRSAFPLLSLFIAVITFCLLVGTASAEYRLLHLHYQNASGEDGITTFDYDETGRRSIAVWRLLDGTRFSLNRFEYNEVGQRIRRDRAFSEGRKSTEVFTYDDQGRLIRETYERSDSVTGGAIYTYDENGYPLETVCDNHRGWLTAVLKHECDDEGRKVSSIIMQDTTQVGTVAYEYGDHGKLTREHWDVGDGKWTQTFEYEYELCKRDKSPVYTSSNVFTPRSSEFRLVGENYDYSGQVGGPSYYAYDPTDKLVRKTFRRSDGLMTETHFLYDCSGELLVSHRAYTDGRSAIFVYHYNDNASLAERTFYRSDSVSGSESYNYDEAGRLVSGRLDNFDAWLTGNLEFSHTDFGRPASGRFSADDGKTAELVFEYDDNENPVKIRWDFDDGTSQTYEFRFQPLN